MSRPWIDSHPHLEESLEIESVTLGTTEGVAVAWPSGGVGITLGLNNSNDDYGVDVIVTHEQWVAFRDTVEALFKTALPYVATAVLVLALMVSCNMA